MENLAAVPWLFAIAGGAVILGLVIAYGMRRNRQRTRADESRAEAGTREIYREDERGERV